MMNTNVKLSVSPSTHIKEAAHLHDLTIARAEEAQSMVAARPLTARSPAPGYGHTHEAHAARGARGSE
jgi:hypothetical protein